MRTVKCLVFVLLGGDVKCCVCAVLYVSEREREREWCMVAMNMR